MDRCFVQYLAHKGSKPLAMQTRQDRIEMDEVSRKCRWSELGCRIYKNQEPSRAEQRMERMIIEILGMLIGISVDSPFTKLEDGKPWQV